MTYLYNKYRPNNLDDIKYHNNIVKILKNLDKNDIPHIILYGLNGSGKKTLLYSFINNTSKKKKFYKYKSPNKDIFFSLIKYDNVIEIDIAEMGMYNKFIIRDVIKDFVETKKVDNNSIQIIILHHSEILDKETQFILRRIMELYIHNCRFILLSNSINKIIEPIKSRCLLLRVKCLNNDDILKELIIIKNKENFKINDSVLENIIINSNRNFKKCILELEYYNLNKKYNSLISILSKLNNLIKKKNINNKLFNDINDFLYKFIINNEYNTTDLFKIIYFYFINIMDNDEDKIKLTHIIAKYEYNYILGSKDIIHLQSFIYELYNIINN